MSPLHWDDPTVDPLADLKAAKEAAPVAHERMLDVWYAEWLCPAPIGNSRACLVPIPCQTHGVDSEMLGFALYGYSYQLVPRQDT